MEVLADFFRVLWDLLKGYFTNGFPFLVAHAVVIIFIIVDSWLRKIRQETEALWQWVPNRTQTQPGGEPNTVEPQADAAKAARTPSSQPASEPGETTKILDRFVEESEELGVHGFFVPMTDFSDRLDSIVDGMVAELHDRTNLLLLVGIAGTMFGVFEFAYRALEVVQNQNLEAAQRILSLGQFLSSTMKKAFPVGFMGLILTLGFQIWAAFPERRLRAALAEATRKALQRRKEVSTSQAEIVRQSAQAIEHAMEPLKNLEQTLKKSVEPVVKVFGERLDQSLQLVTEQFSQLQNATNSIHEAVGGVREGVTSLHSAADSLKDLLQDTPKVLQNMIDLQSKQESSLREFDALVRDYDFKATQLATELTRTLESLTQMPEKVLVEAKDAFGTLRNESLKVWQDVAVDFRQGIQAEFSELLAQIQTRAEVILATLVTATQELNQVAKGAENALEGLSKLPENLQSEITLVSRKWNRDFLDFSRYPWVHERRTRHDAYRT